MALLQILVLSVIQGITEFLPISSAGHLALLPHLTGLPDQGLMLDVAVHVGTLGAVFAYLWRDILAMLGGVVKAGSPRTDPGVRLLVQLVVATIPLTIVGFIVWSYAGTMLRSVEVIAWATIGFGVVLYLTDRLGLTVKKMEHMTIGVAFLVGIAQCFALIPGASRAGVTISAARMLGFERREAARFSMLMSIPAICAAATPLVLELMQDGTAEFRAAAILAGFLAFITALIAITFMMNWLRQASYTPFVVYRLLLGGGLLIWIYAY